MTLSPPLRKLALTAHVATSVGWLGAIAAFLALAVTGLTTADPQLARAVYRAMDLITQWTIVPFCFASLATGLVSSLGTTWGLFRHYWVLIKLLITLLSTLILLVHVAPIRHLAGVAVGTTLSGADLRPQIQMVVAASGAVMALLVTTVLSVYKPRGLTRYGWRKQREQRSVAAGIGPAT